MNNLTLTWCQTCAGTGLTEVGEGHATCPTCHGEGGWLLTEEGVILSYPFPHLHNSHGLQEIKVGRWLHYGAAGISLLVMLTTTLSLISEEGFTGLQFFWTQGALHAVFGLSGLATVWALSSLEQQQSSQLSLHELAENTASLPAQSEHSLKPYANERLNELFYHATEVAERLHTYAIDEIIMLIALLEQPRIIGLFARLETSMSELRRELSEQVKIPADKAPRQLYHVTANARARVYGAYLQAIQNNFPYADLEDLLLDYAANQGQFSETFKKYDISYDAVYAVSRWYAEEQEEMRQWAFWKERGRTRPRGYMNKAWTALPTPFLDQFSIDITSQAAAGNLSRVAVRDQEISEILEILGQGRGGNVLLVGEPGVGKESIVGAIAQRMVEENVPEPLKDKRLLSVDLSSLLSGENPEEALQTALQEISQAGNVILAVPRIEMLVGTSDGALDAASTLAAALNRGDLQLISTATYADFHRFVESNQTLKSLLEVIEIKEMSTDQALTVLEEEAALVEGQQGVFFTYGALSSAVQLAQRYLPEKMLPTSALSLIEGAASSAHQAGKRWVNQADVEKVVEKHTKIPVSQAAGQEAEMLLHLEDTLHEKIIGQEEAVRAVSQALRRARAGLHVDKRPISSFLFVGPTGVGKTETAKAIAEVYFGSVESMVRLDMSEYQDSQALYKLLGAPSSSESYAEGGTLTTPVREHPFSLILLDELEKASPDVLNLFLQLLEDGRVTETSGRVVHYNNAIIIATSNAGSAEILQLLQQGISQDDLHTQLTRILEGQFRPEFINRFDAVIPFHALRPEEIEQITRLMLQSVIDKAATQGYAIQFSDEAIQKIAQLGFDPLYGARPLRRVIQDKIEGLLAERILSHQLQPRQTLIVTPDMVQ